MSPSFFVHCVCLKSLASYLYTELDDSFNECPEAASKLSLFSEKKVDSLDLQSFCVSFVLFFRNNYTDRKRSFYHLTEQFLNFLSTLFPPKIFPPTLSFHSPYTCTYCHDASHFLVKCQHKDCFTFTHFPCYLNHSHKCFHVMLKSSSVSLLFYCDAHYAEGLQTVQTDAITQNQGISAGTRLGSRTRETIRHCRAFLRELATSANPMVVARDSFFFAHMQNYREWLGVAPWQERRLHWSSRKFQLEGNPHDGRYILHRSGKKDLCGVCHDELGKEIFPRLLSHAVECKKCGAKAHEFCVRDGKRKEWLCARCSHEDAACAFCHKSEGFLSCVNDELCHVSCLLGSLCGATDGTCSHCQSTGCVFHCCVKGCSYCSHFVCGEKSHDCLFALAQPPAIRDTDEAPGTASPTQVSVFFVCSMHINSMEIDSIVETATPATFSLSESHFLWSLLHPLRCCLSLSSEHVYNNTPAEQRLRTIFTQAGFVDIPVKKKRRKPLQDKEKSNVKPHKEARSRSHIVSMSKRDESDSAASLTSTGSAGSAGSTGSAGSAGSTGSAGSSTRTCKSNRSKQWGIIERVIHRSARDESLDCHDLWRYVGQILDKRLPKREVMKLLRMDPKQVGHEDDNES